MRNDAQRHKDQERRPGQVQQDDYTQPRVPGGVCGNRDILTVS